MQNQIQSLSISPDGAAMQTTYFEKEVDAVITRDIAALCKFCSAQQEFDSITRTMFQKPRKWALLVGGTPKNPLRFYICTDCCKEIAHAK